MTYENSLFFLLTFKLYVFVEAVLLKVSLGVRFLISEVVVDNEYKSHAKGLMGNFDGNAANEFVLPNGTILDDNATGTERDIYNNFGQKCEDMICYNV